MTEPQPKVFVVDDEDAICRAISRLLQSAGYVCESYNSASQFINAYNPTIPGCLILDVKMDHLSGLELQIELTNRGVAIPIVFISGNAEVPSVVQAMKGGAIDFLEKPFRDDVLLQRVEAAIDQDTRLRQKLNDLGAIKSHLKSLTAREQEVLSLMVVGKSPKQIGIELHISPKTADVHKANVLKKMHVTNAVELAQLMHRVDVDSHDDQTQVCDLEYPMG